MRPDRLQMVPEGEEPPEEPPTPPDEIQETPEETNGDPEQEDGRQEARNPQGPPRGQVRKLTDYFNKIGGPTTPKAPKTVQKTVPVVTPRTPGSKKTPGAGGISKSKRKKGKIKIEEPQRAKLELAMRTFLKKKPPEN